VQTIPLDLRQGGYKTYLSTGTRTRERTLRLVVLIAKLEEHSRV